MRYTHLAIGVIACLGLGGCVAPLRGTQPTALCSQGALAHSGWATDIKINAPDKSHGWTVTFQRRNADGTATVETVGFGSDMFTGQGMYWTDDHQTIGLLRMKCPGAAYPGPDVVAGNEIRTPAPAN